jgi:isoquinoline 1-oxidoreductase subunit beta
MPEAPKSNAPKTATTALLPTLPEFPKLSRRKIIVGLFAGIGLGVGYVVWPRHPDLNLVARDDETILNGWIKIGKDGRVVVVIPQAEMGQGVYTSLAMIVAEELGAKWDSISVEPAPRHPVYANKVAMDEGLGILPRFTRGTAKWVVDKVVERNAFQITGGSTSVRAYHDTLRLAAATARDLLRKAAAREWNMDWQAIEINNGTVFAADRSIGFESLIAKINPDDAEENPKLKSKELFSIVGKNVPRLDIPAKTDGSAGFGMDVRLPGMVYAAVRAGPMNEGLLMDADDSAAKKMPGFIRTVKSKTWVAVVADRYWVAKTALDAVKIDFNFRDSEQIDNDWLKGNLRDVFSNGKAHVYEENGDPKQIIDSAKIKLTAEYSVPYLAHAPLEPLNATARINADDSIEVWAPTQSITVSINAIARALDIGIEKIRVYPTLIGGGFGAKAEIDAIVQAVICAKQVGKPVQLIWSREEDFRQDKFRPAFLARLSGSVDGQRHMSGFTARLASQSASGGFSRRAMPMIATDEPDVTSVQGLLQSPYDFGTRHIEHVVAKLPVEVGFWRSVGHSANAFFLESFIDELAVKADIHPVKFRLGLLKNAPRHLKVMQECAERAGPPAEGRGRGFAFHESFGSICAQAVDVAITSQGVAEVKRIVCVIDCGKVVHPDTVIAQMEGGIIFGLTAALFGKVDFNQGYSTVENFDSYPLLTLAQTPDIEVYIIDSDAPHGGVGEVGTPPIAPAVTNAIFNATGIRIRNLPIAGVKLLSAAAIKEAQKIEAFEGAAKESQVPPLSPDVTTPDSATPVQ